MRGSCEWKRGWGWLRVVTVTVNVSRVKHEDLLGTVILAGCCAGGRGPDPGAAHEDMEGNGC